MKLLDYWDGKFSSSETDTVLDNEEVSDWNTSAYYKILCGEFPSFLNEYISIPLLQRLSGVSLLCGTDWTKLFKNRFKYSRLDHSIGCALIVWNFTHDKKQTIAALLHDVSTPAFSHVVDFKNGDSLKQESTENLNAVMISQSRELLELLKKDKLLLCDVDDYHKYPVADNDRPALSSDRLEYMFPSGAALDGEWTLDEIKKCYSAIRVLKNEKGVDELGFIDEAQAVLYTKKFCAIGHLLQRNEDKVAMQLMADVLSFGIDEKLFSEKDFYVYDEAWFIKKLSDFCERNPGSKLSRLYYTYTGMTNVIHSDEALENCWCVSLDVKARYVNPLLLCADGKARRISEVNKEAELCIENFLSFKDTRYGCVPYREKA